MLALLKINNLALVEDLTWELGKGLIGVTGQTGAGKSMIVGALKLILGERANRSLIRNGESNCTVEAVFFLSTNLLEVNDLLTESGLDPCDGETLVIKRSFGSGNSNFVNCSPCTVSVLKKLGGLLIDLHGPHEHQSLLSQERQLAMLDAYAQAGKQLKSYAKAYREWGRAVAELEEFKGLGKSTDQEIELLRFQLDEISRAALVEAEMVDLDRRYTQARNAARLISASNQSIEALQNAGEALTEARKNLSDLEKLDPDCAEFISGFDSARLELAELESNLEDYTGGLEVEPAELVAMEHRIDQIEHLKRKYGQTISEVLAYEKVARARLDKVDHREEEISRLEGLVAESRARLDKAGASLSKIRNKAIPKLATDIANQLEGLGFQQSKFEVSVETSEEPGPAGFEAVDFLFGPNPGEPVKPLRVIASSGEMSRVMLALKTALADQDETPLMVFDEIDANVGGEIAGAVGAKMAALGERHQVISITHMPQVAARAALHFRVTKEIDDQSTETKIRKIENEERIAELARMLGGVGDESIALAEKLLNANS